MTKPNHIDIDDFRAHFVADFDRGRLFRKMKAEKLKEVGTRDTAGYVRFCFRRTLYNRSRVLYAMYHGHLDRFFVVDHKNHKRDDDRIDNLRTLTKSQNSMNRRRSPKHRSKSGYIGVYPNKKRSKHPYYALAFIDKKLVYLGEFSSAFEAALAHDRAKTQAFGEFGFTNARAGLI